MDTLVRAGAAAVVAAILISLIKKHSAAMALALSLACCCLLGAAFAELLRPVLSFASRLREVAGLPGAFLSPLLKVVSVGLVTQLCGAVCSDAGEGALTRLVTLCGSAAALYCALPLMEAVLALVSTLLEG